MGLAAKRREPMAMALCLAVLLVLAAFLAVEVYDLDIWWQIAIGRDILAHGRVPEVDLYTLTAAGRPYHDSHWLFQVVVALADRCGGMAGVQGVMIALWGGTFYALYRTATRYAAPHAVAPFLLLLIAALACSERFLPRPELTTCLMIALFAWRLGGNPVPSRGEIALLVLLQGVWSNCHGLFVVGPFMVGCYWLVAAIEARGAWTPQFRGLSLLLGGVIAATLATPFGFAGWSYALLLFREAGPNAPQLLAKIGELSPTFGAASRSGMAFWFYLALIVLWGGALCAALRRGGIAWPRVLIAAVLLGLSLTGRRNMVLFALVAPPLVLEHAPQALKERLEGWLRRPAAAFPLLLLLALLAWYPLSGRYYYDLHLPARSGFGATPSFFPHRLPQALAALGFSGPVFNSNTLGGFYLYHAPPGGRSFSDGRWEIYDPRTFDEIDRAVRGGAAWERLVARYAIAGVLLQHSSLEAGPLLPVLAAGGWKLVYCDYAASFWVPAAHPAAPLGFSAAALLAQPPVRLDDCLMIDPFLAAAGAGEARLANLRQALRFAPRNPRVLESLGLLLVQGGAYAEGEETIARLLQVEPENVRGLNEAAFLAHRRGDTAAARAALLRILAVDPGNVEARENLRRLPPIPNGGAR